jgi:UDP-N-acetylmuramoyl-tripeptide--D-alanyl-D-alanine ligase
MESGAVAVLAERDLGLPSILVPDSTVALGQLARDVFRRLDPAAVVGITGSSGKTSTKDLIAGLLGQLGPTLAPVGSYNNETGHPLTLLRAERDTKYLVLEVSARAVGHITYLCSLAPPEIGVVLNVGSAHLGAFGDRETIALAKGELVEALPANGVAVLNADDPAVLAMRDRTQARILTFGQAPHAAVRAEGVSHDHEARASFRLVSPWGAADVSLRLHGAHHVANALAAAAVAGELGIPVTEIAATLSEAGSRSHWRMEVHRRADGVTVVNDAYNANPESVAAALRALATMSGDRGAGARRSWAVLGKMAELGAGSDQAHEEVGRVARSLGIARIVVVGEAAAAIRDGAVAAGMSEEEVVVVQDAAAARSVLDAEMRSGDVVLVKASRSVGLESLALGLASEDHE